MSSDKDELSFKLNATRATIYAVGGCLLLSGIIYRFFLFMTSPPVMTEEKVKVTGLIGDTLGGIAGPVIGITGIILTFLAFYIQYKANEVQYEQFKRQNKERVKEGYQNKILFLMEQNRSIVNSMTVGEVEGFGCFTHIFNEVRVAHQFIDEFYDGKLSNDKIINIAYIIVYNGVGDATNIVNHAIFKDVENLPLLLKCFEIISEQRSDANVLEGFDLSDEAKNILRTIPYSPYIGHLTTLGHYFRNLFHLLSYTDSIPETHISRPEKYEIIKSLRTQMTSYEQTIIYFNSLSFYGKPMREKDHINTYQIIKNIQLPLVEFAGDIRKRYPHVEFEWDEVVARVSSTHTAP